MPKVERSKVRVTSLYKKRNHSSSLMFAARKRSGQLVCAFSCTVRARALLAAGGVRKGEVADCSRMSPACPAGWWVGTATTCSSGSERVRAARNAWGDCG